MLRSSVVRLLLLLVFLGCTAPPGRESFVLRIAMWGPLGELTPGSLGKESGLASIAEPWVYETVVNVDAGGELKPGLAARIERGEKIRIHLRHDAVFSDGVPVTEADVVRSLEAGGLRVTPSGEGLIVEARERG